MIDKKKLTLLIIAVAILLAFALRHFDAKRINKKYDRILNQCVKTINPEEKTKYCYGKIDRGGEDAIIIIYDKNEEIKKNNCVRDLWWKKEVLEKMPFFGSLRNFSYRHISGQFYLVSFSPAGNDHVSAEICR